MKPQAPEGMNSIMIATDPARCWCYYVSRRLVFVHVKYHMTVYE
jgi:hypothetical protein